jgi:hypothetical protein
MSRPVFSYAIVRSEGVKFDTEAAHAALMASHAYQQIHLEGRPLFREKEGRFQMREEFYPNSWKDQVDLPEDLSDAWLALLSRHLQAGEVVLTVTELPDDPSEPRRSRAFRMTPGQVLGDVATVELLSYARIIVTQGCVVPVVQRQHTVTGPAALTESQFQDDPFLALSLAKATPVFVADQAVILSQAAYEALLAGR